MSITAKLKFATLLFGGDAVKELAYFVVSEQRSVQHAHFAVQPHPRRPVGFQEQFLGILVDGEEQQIL